MMVQNAETEVVWGCKGAIKVMGNVTIDRVHMTSYSTFIETIRLTSIVFEI